MIKIIRPPRFGSAPPHRRVLALCGDTQVGLWMVRCLGKNGIKVLSVCRSPDGLAAHSRYSAGVGYHLAGSTIEAFIDSLAGLVRRHNIGSIMPISEAYHNHLIHHLDRFMPDVHVFSPSRDCFDKATDKNYMHELCLRLGVPVARGTTLDKFIASHNHDLRYPLVLRTSSQHAATGKAPWKAAYATSREKLDKLHASVAHIADNVLVQEYHPGGEDHVQVLMHQGEAFMTGEYIGEHHMPLAGGVTVQRISYRNESLTRDAVKILKTLGWDGIAGVQFHTDPRTGKYIFLEINPRFIGGLPTVIMAGFPASFLLWQSRFEPDKMKVYPYTLGLRTRILGGDANWLLGMIRGDELPPDQTRLSRLSAAARFLWNCGPWTRDDVFLPEDLKPFWIDLKQMARRLRERSVTLIDNPT